MDFVQTLQSTFNSIGPAIGSFLLNLVAFIIIMIIGWIIAKLIQRAINFILDKVRFNRLAERGVVGEALSSSDYTASGLIAKVFYYAVLLITLQVAFSAFGPNPISTMLAGVVAWLPKAAVAIVIVVIASAVAKAVKDLVSNALSGMSYGGLLGNIAAVLILAIGAIAALNQIEVATTVTTPVLVTILATAGGILVVGLGGGAIKPMQQRWERWLNGLERETSSAFETGRAHAQEAPAQQAENATRYEAPR